MPRTARPQRLGPGRWRIRWIDHTGKRRSRVFSDFGEAERALRAHQNAADEVRRGIRAAPPEDRTFDELTGYSTTSDNLLQHGPTPSSVLASLISSASD